MDDREGLIPNAGEGKWMALKQTTFVLSIALAVVFFFIAIIMTTLYMGAPSIEPQRWPPLQDGLLGKYSSASVAADHVLCSEIGRDILIKGGNAVDAAIAGIVCLGIVNPQSSGIGGGHFMTIYNKTTGLCSTVDARETAPAAAEEHMFKGNVNGSKIGWKAMGVPGELHGLYTEYKRFGGGLPWKALLQPSIDLLDNGVPVSMGMHVCLRDEAANIKADKGLAKDFVDPKTGEVYKYGDVMHTRKNHRNLLKSLADSADPIDTFYKGWVAKQLVFELNESKEAIMTKEDIANYKSIVRDQSEVIYTDLPNNFRMCGPPPPSSSAVTQSIIKTLSGYQFDQSTSHQLVDGLHKYIEASKFAFAHRSEMGDMAFVNGSLQLARNITSEEYVQTVRNRITDRAQPTEKYGGKFSFQMDKGTTNIAVIDQYGNSVVATSTVNLFFGARVASESTGIIWNSQMDDFSNPDAPNFYGYPPSPANFIKPGKRPMSSISPIVLFNKTDKAVQLAFGGAGGSPFGDMFGGIGSSSGRRRGPRKGEETVFPLKISLEDAYNGKTSKLQITKKIVCTGCKATGSKSGKNYTCGKCKGRGQVMAMRQIGPGMVTQTVVACPECRGEGNRTVPREDVCGECSGNKTKTVQKVLEVVVNRGMDDNEKIVFRNEGDQLDPEVQPGDVIIIIQVKEHETFKRKGDDLFMKKEISLNEALCGYEFLVTHLDGRKILMKNKPGEIIVPKTFRGISGEGMPTTRHHDIKGNLVVEFEIKFPSPHFLDDENKYKLLEKQFAAVKKVSPPAGAEEVSLMEYDEHRYRKSGQGAGQAYDEDDSDEEGGQGGHPGVQCAQS